MKKKKGKKTHVIFTKKHPITVLCDPTIRWWNLLLCSVGLWSMCRTISRKNGLKCQWYWLWGNKLIKWQRSFHGVQLRNRWSYWLCLLQLICCMLLEVTIYIYTHTTLLNTTNLSQWTETATWIGGYCDPIKIWVSCWTWFSHFYVPG